MDTATHTDNINPVIRPLSFYLEKYRIADPVFLSNRLGIPFDLSRHEFLFSFMGRTYAATHPDLQIRCVNEKDRFSLNQSESFKSMILRFFLYGAIYSPNGDFRSVGEFPAGEKWAEQFEIQCEQKTARRYGRLLQAFEAIMEDLDAIRILGADIAYELEFLDGLSIRFLFRKKHGEPGSDARILFSGNFPAAFSAGELTGIIELCLEIFDAADPLYAAANPYR